MMSSFVRMIKDNGKKKKAELAIEEIKRALLEDQKFKEEILRELEYRTGRRDFLRVGVLSLLGLTTIAGGVHAQNATPFSDIDRNVVREVVSDYIQDFVDGIKIPKPCTCIVSQDGTGDYDVSPGEDASEVIQKAVDEVHSKGGGEVRIREGDYNIEQTVKITGGNISITGEGWNTALLPKGTKPAIHIKGKGSGAESHISDIVLSNFKIHSNRSVETDGILLEYTHSVKLDNLYIYGLRGYAVKQVEDWELRATRITISQCGDVGKACWIATKSSRDYTNHAEFLSVKIGTQYADGMHITYGTHQIRFNMCKFTVWGGNNNAIVVETPNDSPMETREIKFELCQFETAGHATKGSAIKLNNVKNVTINNCNFGSEYSKGITGSTRVGWIVVSNSHFVGLDVGIEFDNRILVTGNYFVNCERGIVGGGHDKNIVGNTFYEIKKEAIRLINPYYTSIVGNSIVNYSLSSNGEYSGIYLWNPHFCSVKDNYIVNRSYKGKYSIEERGDLAEETVIENNYVNEGIYSESARVKKNAGYPTENSGVAVIPAGKTKVTVEHGLAKAPSKVLVTPRENVGSVWVTNVTSKQFTINCSAAPKSNVQVDWYAEI